MHKTVLVSLLTGLGLLLAQTFSFAGGLLPTATDKYVQGQVLVKFKPGMAAAARAQMVQNYGAQAMLALGEQSDVVLAQLTPGQTVVQAVSAFSNDPNVAYAQPNYIYHAQAVPTDPQYGQLWAAKNTGQAVNSVVQGEGWIYTTNNPGTPGDDMNLESAWNVQTDCSTVVVAVVDSGINYNSTDLTANMWMGNANHGQNFASDATIGTGSDPMDLMGHGTNVAGIIGAQANNGTAGVGVCWKASLMAVRVLDATGAGYTSTIISGVGYAVSNGAKVINMSLGGGGVFDQAYSDAITSAQNANVLVVVAAGNSATDNDAATTPDWPCNFTQPNLICVAALDQKYALASFSDWGATSVDVGAPGTNIFNTWAGTSTVITDMTYGGPAPTGWTFSSTTSGSTPPGGWAPATGGWLLDPGTNWGAALYNASTDDRAYKTFNLAGVNVAVLAANIGVNVTNGDYFNVNYKSIGGDPFVGGTNLGSVTNWHDGNAASPGQINISSCISATCSIGVQLLSGATMPKDIGVEMTNFSINTLTLNANSYNTLNGTSQATPEVAGVAALVWAHNPLYTYADVANAIEKGGRATASLAGKTTSGNAVDAMGAIAYISPPTGIAVVVQ